MEEGMARTIETTSEKKQQTQKKPTEQQSFLSKKDAEPKISLEVYRFFGVDPSTRSGDQHLAMINEWAQEGTTSVGSALKKIKNLELKLGQPKLDETRTSRLYNWIRMSKSINQTSNSMKQELRNIKEKFRNEMSKIENNYQDRISKIDNEMARILNEKRNAVKTMKHRKMSELSKIQDTYEEQLKELRSIRSAYKGR